MIADIMTKFLGGKQFEFLRDLLTGEKVFDTVAIQFALNQVQETKEMTMCIFLNVQLDGVALQPRSS